MDCKVYRGRRRSIERVAGVCGQNDQSSSRCSSSGKSDWGVFRDPARWNACKRLSVTEMVARHLLDGAGHWADQEQPEQVSKLIVEFLQHK